MKERDTFRGKEAAALIDRSVNLYKAKYTPYKETHALQRENGKKEETSHSKQRHLNPRTRLGCFILVQSCQTNVRDNLASI